MVDRRLLLHFQGAPVCWGLTAGDIRHRILEFPDDKADSLQVWEVPSHHLISGGEDITRRFARDWSKEFKFGDGLDPSEYLAPFPAFVREHAGDRLIEAWTAAIADREKRRPRRQLPPELSAEDRVSHVSAPIDEVLGTSDPEFTAWAESMPDKYWAKYDLSACRIGWEARKRAELTRPPMTGNDAAEAILALPIGTVFLVKDLPGTNRKRTYNAATYLARTRILERLGYGKYRRIS